MYGQFDSDNTSHTEEDDDDVQYTPTSLGTELNKVISRNFSHISLKGEVSSFTISRSGHAYFTLIDDKLPIECSTWRSRLDSRCSDVLNSDVTSHVISVKGDVKVGKYDNRLRCEVYDASIVQDVNAQWSTILENWESTLRCEGLLDESRRRILPRLVKKVVVITSDTGAVIHDMMHVLNQSPLRHMITFELRTCAVQGKDCVPTILRQLDQIETGAVHTDCVAIVRGGGSDEDLKEYHHIDLCRGVARFQKNTSIPVVCAIGHAEDRVLLDQVVDVACVTPTAVANMLVEHGRRIVYDVCSRLDHYPAVLLNKAIRRWRDRVNTHKRMHHWIKTRTQREKTRLCQRVLDRLKSITRHTHLKHRNIHTLIHKNAKRTLAYAFTALQSYAHAHHMRQRVVTRLVKHVYTKMLGNALRRWTLYTSNKPLLGIFTEDGVAFDPNDAPSRGTFILHHAHGKQYKIWYTKIRSLDGLAGQ